VANITLYYEHSGFSVRVSEHYRSANRQYITTFGPPNRGGDVSSGGGFSTAQAEKVVDGQISYAIQSGPAKGLSFYLQAYNLNDEPLITLQNNDPRQVMNYQKYGASYSFGASYKF
jgi:iron complex outermembrane receptor protein